MTVPMTLESFIDSHPDLWAAIVERVQHCYANPDPFTAGMIHSVVIVSGGVFTDEQVFAAAKETDGPAA